MIYVSGYFGLGDNIYQYPFIKKLSQIHEKVYLSTPFPEIYRSLPNVVFCKPDTRLKTQADNIDKIPGTEWVETPTDIPKIKFDYHQGRRNGLSILKSFERNSGMSIDKFELPVDPDWVKNAKKFFPVTSKQICILKLPTIRDEWLNVSRNPPMKYFKMIVNEFKDRFFFISLSDNRGGERFSETPPDVDMALHMGEMPWTTILGAITMADMVICYPSFFLPASIALKTPCFCLYGGSAGNRYLTDPIMNLDRYAYLEPAPMCNCFETQHDCNKNLDTNVMMRRIRTLCDKTQITTEVKLPYKKPKLLVCRLKSFRCEKIQANPYIKSHFGPIVTIDHEPLSTYKGRGFEASYQWPLVNKENECRQLANDIIEQNGITHAIIGQKLYEYSTYMEEACIRHGVKVIWAEAFFDNKLVYDTVGLQYCKENEIYRFVNKTPVEPPRLPSGTREDQPPTIGSEEVFRKYVLKHGEQHIVIMGQLPWDMSLKHSVNINYTNYLSFVNLLIDRNPKVRFLFKPHPKDNKQDRFGNKVVYINESLATLFATFEKFVAFSSTTIFEGLVYKKKFATMGYHLCNSDDLVFQMRTDSKINGVNESLDHLVINEETRQKYISFICNHYAIDFNSERLLNKILLTPEEYYGQ